MTRISTVCTIERQIVIHRYKAAAHVPIPICAVPYERRARPPLERTGFYDRMLMSQRGLYNGEFYTPEVLDSRMAMQTSQVLLNSRHARIEYKSGRYPVIRGRQGCVMAIVIDGRRVNGAAETI